MLSYRHMYHAGNYADVFKHALLTRLLLALGHKDKPYCYHDTHAGIGRYDLMHPWAQKAREYDNGITKLWGRDDIPEALAPYMAAVKAANPYPNLRFYPGSPFIARHLLRAGDRMVLTELNRDDCAELKLQFAGDRQVAVHLLDGYQGLKAFLPPAERRGLVLLDSSFDRAKEFMRIATALREAHARWPTGMYAVWYPLMEPGAMLGFAREIESSGIRKILRLEFSVMLEDAAITPGCGMLVINPPYQFKEEAKPLLDWLWRVLSVEGAGGVKVDWLVRE